MTADVRQYFFENDDFKITYALKYVEGEGKGYLDSSANFKKYL